MKPKSAETVTLDFETFRRARLSWQNQVKVGDKVISNAEVIARAEPLLTGERLARIRSVIAGRTRNLVAAIENPYDLGNISAVMRSAESFGILEVGLITSPDAKFKAANRVAKGSEKWLDIPVFRSAKEATDNWRGRGLQILCTHLEKSEDLSDIDFSKPTVVVLGNEKDGVSAEMVSMADGCVRIPMQGFTQSFNLSVAGALVFYHAWRERERQLGASGDLSEVEKVQLYAQYLLRCLDKPETILKPDLEIRNGFNK